MNNPELETYTPTNQGLEKMVRRKSFIQTIYLAHLSYQEVGCPFTNMA